MVMFRLSGIFILAPIFGSTTIPRTVKVMLVFTLTCCIYPMLMNPGNASASMFAPILDNDLNIWLLLPYIAMELLIGLVIGFCASLPLIGMQISGDIIDSQIGIGFAKIVNPETGDQAGVMSNALFMMALAIFAILGGHRIMLRILVGSFETVPIGGFADFAKIQGLVEFVLSLLTVIFQMGFRIAAPLLCLIFLQTIALGFIARTVPQLSIMSVGFTIRILNGTTLMIAFISIAGWIYAEEMMAILEEIAQFFGVVV